MLHEGDDLGVTDELGFSHGRVPDVYDRVRTFWVSFRKLVMPKLYVSRGHFTFALGISLGFGGIGHAHSGIVDGYGCHRGPDKASYQCHQGQFAGRTFKSKDEFLRELRRGTSERLSPKSNQPRVEKKNDNWNPFDPAS